MLIFRGLGQQHRSAPMMHLGMQPQPLSAQSFLPAKTFGGPDRHCGIDVLKQTANSTRARNKVAMVAPEVTLTHLYRADGSATYTHNGYSIIGAVNGPIEVQRRDEQPEEATVEVNIRPASGVGSM